LHEKQYQKELKAQAKLERERMRKERSEGAEISKRQKSKPKSLPSKQKGNDYY
jgi:hypothetical protein